MVFQRIRDVNFKLKPTKVCHFQWEIKFLGHSISAQGVAMDTSKTDEILNWHSPRSVSEVRTFMGLCSYYRRYVQGFVRITGPLHKLTKAYAPFVWAERQQTAFETLEAARMSAPILTMSQDEGTFVLDVDASDLAVGAVLLQTQGEELRVIGYASRIFQCV